MAAIATRGAHAAPAGEMAQRKGMVSALGRVDLDWVLPTRRQAHPQLWDALLRYSAAAAGTHTRSVPPSLEAPPGPRRTQRSFRSIERAYSPSTPQGGLDIPRSPSNGFFGPQGFGAKSSLLPSEGAPSPGYSSRTSSFGSSPTQSYGSPQSDRAGVAAWPAPPNGGKGQEAWAEFDMPPPPAGRRRPSGQVAGELSSAQMNGRVSQIRQQFERGCKPRSPANGDGDNRGKLAAKSRRIGSDGKPRQVAFVTEQDHVPIGIPVNGESAHAVPGTVVSAPASWK